MTDLDDQHSDIREGRGRKSGGASIEMLDGRLSSAIYWVLAAVGTGLIAVGGWGVAALIGIKENMASMAATVSANTTAIVARLDKKDAKDDQQDNDIRNLNQHVYVLEGKALRGVPFDQEARRGK